MTATTQILKVHWECWSECNLHCEFCYRTRSVPMPTDAAKTMLVKLREAGVAQFVFAGGDPLIRPDIEELVTFAADLGLRLEMQTNCHFVPRNLNTWVEKIALFGVSLDGAVSSVHDKMRNKTGNFEKVRSYIRLLERLKRRYIVRTIVAKENRDGIFELGHYLTTLKLISRWSLLEFDQVGDGLRHANRFALSHSEFLDAASELVQSFGSMIKVDIYDRSRKGGVYVLIRADGAVYTTGGSLDDGFYKIVGSILDEPFEALVDRLDFSTQRHLERYQQLM